MKILVSACLTGENCKYNGGNNDAPHVIAFLQGHEILPVCPERLAGLGIPRNPVEIVNGILMDRHGNSVDRQLRETIEKLVDEFKLQNIDCAVLQSRSPTCGVKRVYDGTFSGHLIPGMGVFAQALKEWERSIQGISQSVYERNMLRCIITIPGMQSNEKAKISLDSITTFARHNGLIPCCATCGGTLNWSVPWARKRRPWLSPRT